MLLTCMPYPINSLVVIMICIGMYFGMLDAFDMSINIKNASVRRVNDDHVTIVQFQIWNTNVMKNMINNVKIGISNAFVMIYC